LSGWVAAARRRNALRTLSCAAPGSTPRTSQKVSGWRPVPVIPVSISSWLQGEECEKLPQLPSRHLCCFGQFPGRVNPSEEGGQQQQKQTFSCNNINSLLPWSKDATTHALVYDCEDFVRLCFYRPKCPRVAQTSALVPVLATIWSLHTVAV
jgi:hypothetical protein